MQFTSIANLKNNACKIISAVEKGKDTILTKHGRPVAVISHLSEDEIDDYILTHHPKFKNAIEDAYKNSFKHKGKNIEKLIKSLENKL
ncbi:MAG: type II toxin-antitoxin system prevent-host-death family antitoxin [Elusimicrobia bacterium]|nr:type II toxin-antitoxin system prevent-host-death family antitoxin [Elusimicrobiota bacterium]